jgi:hypothetical protein
VTYAFENRPPSQWQHQRHRHHIEIYTRGAIGDQWELLEFRQTLREVRAALDLLKLCLRLKAYNPDQPRVPAGSGRISGQWMGQNTGFPSFRAPASDRPKPVRVAQNRTGRGFLMEEIEPPRINGRRIDLSPPEEIAYEVGLTARNSAVNLARQIDPTYRPPEGLYATINGMMTNLNAQRDDAELFALNAERVARGFQPMTMEEMRSMYSESARNTPMSSIFLRDGNRIGSRLPGSASVVRTVDPPTFSTVVRQGTYGATPIQTPPRYDGLWFERNTTGIIGLRMSQPNGPTIDIIRPDPFSLPLLNKMKVHVHA